MAQLRQRKDEFEERNAQIVTVSFVAGHWAHVWMEETGSPFPFLLDTEREVYETYGMGSSVGAVWQPKVLLYYARRLFSGQPLKPMRGDPHQMGGDFVVDAAGILRFKHVSQNPTDRPAVDLLLRQIDAALERQSS